MTWNDLTFECKELNVEQMNDTYQFARNYEYAEVAAYNVRYAYENDPDWFGFEVDDLDAFESDIKEIIESLYFQMTGQ